MSSLSSYGAPRSSSQILGGNDLFCEIIQISCIRLLDILACGLRHVSKVGEIGSAVYLVVDSRAVSPYTCREMCTLQVGKDRGRNDSRKPDNHADVVELAYTTDLKSVGRNPYEFESRRQHQLPQ